MNEAMERLVKVCDSSMRWLKDTSGGSHHRVSSCCIAGGAKGSMFYTKRYAAGSGLNSSSLDFLPVRNVEESPDVQIGGVMAAVPVGKKGASDNTS